MSREWKMEMECGEKILLQEPIVGRGRKRTLALTNKRLLFLKKDKSEDKIENEIRTEDISEVYPHTDEYTGFITLKIRLKDGTEETVHWKGIGMLPRLLNTRYQRDNVSSTTNRYINAIIKLMNTLP